MLKDFWFNLIIRSNTVGSLSCSCTSGYVEWSAINGCRDKNECTEVATYFHSNSNQNHKFQTKLWNAYIYVYIQKYVTGGSQLPCECRLHEHRRILELRLQTGIYWESNIKRKTFSLNKLKDKDKSKTDTKTKCKAGYTGNPTSNVRYFYPTSWNTNTKCKPGYTGNPTYQMWDCHIRATLAE